jgi:ABC-type glycerol-3-phosphate transport system substrate-binding protein
MTRPSSKRPALAAAAIIVAVLLTNCSGDTGGGNEAEQGARTPDGPVEITFQSLAFQEATVAATEKIVEDWNQANPDVQVTLRQGSWDSVHDRLATQLKAGTAADVINGESSDMTGFGTKGYLADLAPHLSPDVRAAVPEQLWTSVSTSDGKIVAAPTLMQTYVAFANTKAFEDAGVEVPSGDQLEWDEFVGLADDLTQDGSYGVGWGLAEPTAAMMTTAAAHGGTFFEVAADGSATIDIGVTELTTPNYIHQMTYQDRSFDPATLTQSGPDALPGFIDGEYAMFVGGSNLASQLVESAPADFSWAMLPPLAGIQGTAQAVAPQALSVSAQSKHIPQATAFINYLMKPENQAALAEGDWLIPTSEPAREKVEQDTAGEDGWPELMLSARNLQDAPFQRAVDYPRWKATYATPAFQKYFRGEISEDQLGTELTDGWAAAGR